MDRTEASRTSERSRIGAPASSGRGSRKRRRRGALRRLRDRLGVWLKDQAASIRQTDATTVAVALSICLILALGPLPFGAVGMPWRSLLEATIFLTLGLSLAARPAPTPAAATGEASRRAAALLAVVAAWGLVQSLPWPTPLVDLLAPSTAAAWREARALTGAAATSTPVSIAPAITRDAALFWLAGAAALALGGRLGPLRGIRRLAVLALCGGGAFQVLYGAGRWLQRDSKVWGLDVVGDVGRLRGTYVNPDHLALYLAIGLSFAAAWSWWALRKTLDEGSLETHVGRVAMPLVLVGLLFAGLAFTGSRAGLLAALAALSAQGVVLATRRGRRRSSGLVFIALAVALATLAFVGWRQGLARWLETSAYEVAWNARIDAWRATLELWTGAPLVGVGLGAFEEAFARVQPADLPGTWGHAHSDVLETLVTGGLVVAPLLVLAAWLVGRRLVHVLRRGRRSEDRAAALGAIGALVATFLHSLVDFGMTMPATSLALMLVVGLALGAPTGIRRTGPARPRQTVFLHEVDRVPTG